MLAWLLAVTAAVCHCRCSAWHIIFSTSQRRAPSPDGSSARYIHDILLTAALALATLDDAQRHNPDDGSDEGFPHTSYSRNREQDAKYSSFPTKISPAPSAVPRIKRLQK